jgi:4-alpha-glucanotransferase
MKILQFAFDSGPENPYLPHNYTRECVVYTGTHDNDTTLGWFRSLKAKSRDHVLNYLQVSADDIVWEFIRTALASVADYAVIPMQDLLGLDTDGRMNIPGVAAGNWSWRCAKGDFSVKLAARVKNITELYGRFSG